MFDLIMVDILDKLKKNLASNEFYINRKEINNLKNNLLFELLGSNNPNYLKWKIRNLLCKDCCRVIDVTSFHLP